MGISRLTMVNKAFSPISLLRAVNPFSYATYIKYNVYYILCVSQAVELLPLFLPLLLPY